MRQAAKLLRPARFLRLRVLWPVLLLLAAFVFFFQFIATVGGSSDPLPWPPVGTPGPPAAPHSSSYQAPSAVWSLEALPLQSAGQAGFPH